MNENQREIKDWLEYVCKDRYGNDREKMMYDIIAVLALWSDDVFYDRYGELR